MSKVAVLLGSKAEDAGIDMAQDCPGDVDNQIVGTLMGSENEDDDQKQMTRDESSGQTLRPVLRAARDNKSEKTTNLAEKSVPTGKIDHDSSKSRAPPSVAEKKAELENLRRENESMKREINKLTEQMADYLNDRDRWKESYTSIVKQRNQQESRFRVKPLLNLRQNDEVFKQKLEVAELKVKQMQETDRQQKSQVDHLRRELNVQLGKYNDREAEYSSTVQNFLRDQEQKVKELTEQCNELIKQNAIRRTFRPSEDEEALVKALNKLNAAVKGWCLKVWNLWRLNGTARLTSFPLSRKSNSEYITIDNVWLLVACVWEWLLKDVYGQDQGTKNGVFDMWTDEKTASCLKVLEDEITTLQEAELANEWRSFTVQCLSAKPDVARIEKFVISIREWFESSLPDTQKQLLNSDQMMTRFRIEIVIPAVNLLVALRKRYYPIVIATPLTIEEAFRKYQKRRRDHLEQTAQLTLVAYPEMRKYNPSQTVTHDSEYRIIAEAFECSINVIGRRASISGRAELKSFNESVCK